MFTKPLRRAPKCILIKSLILSSNRVEPSPSSFIDVFKKIGTTIKWNWMSKAFKIIAEQYDCPVSYRISNYKNFIPKYLDNAFTDSLRKHPFLLALRRCETSPAAKSEEKRMFSEAILQISLSRTARRLLEEKAPVNDCERTVPSTKK